MEILRFFFFGSVPFDARGQRAVCGFAINDAFRKVVRRVLEDGFLSRQPRQIEIRPGSPGFRMGHVLHAVAARFDALRERDEDSVLLARVFVEELNDE